MKLDEKIGKMTHEENKYKVLEKNDSFFVDVFSTLELEKPTAEFTSRVMRQVATEPLYVLQKEEITPIKSLLFVILGLCSAILFAGVIVYFFVDLPSFRDVLENLLANLLFLNNKIESMSFSGLSIAFTCACSLLLGLHLLLQRMGYSKKLSRRWQHA